MTGLKLSVTISCLFLFVVPSSAQVIEKKALTLAAAQKIAAVATTGYLGFLAGPPLIGLVAEITSLPVALGMVSVFCALVAYRAGIVSPSRQVSAQVAQLTT